MKYGRDILLIIIITAVFFFLIVRVESYFFDRFPPQLPAGITMEQWKASFEHWAKIGVYVAGGASLLWYVVAQLLLKVNKSQNAGKRWIWAVFFLFPIGAIVVGIFFVERAENMFWTNLFFIVNGLLGYYLATLLFSPSSFKYTPLGASQIRRW